MRTLGLVSPKLLKKFKIDIDSISPKVEIKLPRHKRRGSRMLPPIQTKKMLERQDSNVSIKESLKKIQRRRNSLASEVAVHD